MTVMLDKEKSESATGVDIDGGQLRKSQQIQTRVPPVIDENTADNAVDENSTVTPRNGVSTPTSAPRKVANASHKVNSSSVTAVTGDGKAGGILSERSSADDSSVHGGTPHTDRASKTPSRPRVSIGAVHHTKLTSRSSGIGSNNTMNTPAKGLPKFSLSKLLSPSPVVPSVNLSGLNSGGSTYRATGSFKSTRRSLYHDRDLFEMFKRKQDMAARSLTSHKCPFVYLPSGDLGDSTLFGDSIDEGSAQRTEKGSTNLAGNIKKSGDFKSWREKMAAKVRERKQSGQADKKLTTKTKT